MLIYRGQEEEPGLGREEGEAQVCSRTGAVEMSTATGCVSGIQRKDPSWKYSHDA